MLTYKVVFIDWNGTISDSKFWWHLEDKRHPKNHIFEKVEATLFGSLRHLIKPWMRGELNSEEVIKEVTKDAGMSYKETLNEFVNSCKTMEVVSEELYIYLDQLKDKGLKTVIATDNMDSFSRWTVPSLKLDNKFDEIINSSNVKALKQDFDNNGNSKFFERFIKKHAINPKDTVLIDDSEDKENLLSNFGINYMRIGKPIDLIPALKSLLT